MISEVMSASDPELELMMAAAKMLMDAARAFEGTSSNPDFDSAFVHAFVCLLNLTGEPNDEILHTMGVCLAHFLTAVDQRDVSNALEAIQESAEMALVEIRRREAAAGRA